MKKLLLLSFLLFGIINSVSATVFIVNEDTACVTPVMMWFGAYSDLVSSDSVHWDYGDGTLQTWLGSESYHYYTTAGVYVVKAIVCGAGASDTGVFVFSIALGCTNTAISGRVYRDTNANCLYDSPEHTLAHVPVRIQSTGGGIDVTTITDPDGRYGMLLPDDSTYIVTPLFGTAVLPECPASGIATINAATGPDTADFSYACLPALPTDLYVTGSASGFTPGYPRMLTVVAGSDSGCIGTDADLVLILEPALSYDTTGMFPCLLPYLPDTTFGDTLVWHLHDFVMFTGIVPLVCDGSMAMLGDTLCNTAVISLIPTDINPANNTYSICAPVTMSFDPNNKEVMPKGLGNEGYVDATNPLTYQINFQNTGTDTAYEVRIRDTLSANLDPASFTLIDASHSIIVQQSGNELAFLFHHILLPDSATNEALSHGYLLYSAKPLPGVPADAQIFNTASIYFDGNPAVVTNTTLNTIQTTAVFTVHQQAVHIYPNPSGQQLSVDCAGYFTVSLQDIAGRLLRTGYATGHFEIDTRSIPDGIYFVRVSNDTGNSFIQKTIVRH